MRALAFCIAATVAAFVLPAQAADGFEGVHCSAPIPAALMGKTMSNEPVAAIEARHKDLGLHDLGASEGDDGLSTVSWMICGKEYDVLVNQKNVVRDVLPFPAHSKDHPEFVGICRKEGKDLAYEVTAILDNTGANAGKPQLPATGAWRVDEHAGKFITVPTGGLSCPRAGVITADGGM